MKKQELTTAIPEAGVLTDQRNLEVITAEIQFYKKQTGEGILEIGKRLNEAKEKLAHGEWLEWLNDRVEFTEATAQRFMRLAREYANPSLVTELGSSKALILLALPPAERDAFIEDAHEIDGEEKTVSDMSKRELEKAVRERAEALERQKLAEDAATEAKRIADEGAAALKEAEQRAAEAEAEKARLEGELDQLRNAEPTPLPEEEGQMTLEAIREEAAKAAKKEAEAALKKKIEAATEGRKKAEAERDLVKQKADADKAASAERLAALEKKLAAASSESVTIFKTHFENAQGCVNSMLGCLMKLKDAPEVQIKLTAALRALCDKTLQSISTANATPTSEPETPYGSEDDADPEDNTDDGEDGGDE